MVSEGFREGCYCVFVGSYYEERIVLSLLKGQMQKFVKLVISEKPFVSPRWGNVQTYDELTNINRQKIKEKANKRTK